MPRRSPVNDAIDAYLEEYKRQRGCLRCGIRDGLGFYPLHLGAVPFKFSAIPNRLPALSIAEYAACCVTLCVACGRRWNCGPHRVEDLIPTAQLDLDRLKALLGEGQAPIPLPLPVPATPDPDVEVTTTVKVKGQRPRRARTKLPVYRVDRIA